MSRLVLGYDPNPKQVRFFESTARHVAYGGAKAGGKSWAVRAQAIRLAYMYPGINILLLRRTLKELRENHIVPLQKILYGHAKYNDTEKVFTFPTGSRIVMGYCDRESDAERYQGHEYEAIFFEEATRFTEAMYRTLLLCNRGTHPGFSPRAYYTCNPGGVGHEWVKRLFIDRKYRGKENPDDYEFIPALVYDNYVIMERQPEYVSMLEDLPEDLRKALLLGSWDVYQGQYFSEFNRDIHVIEPFPIPAHWPRYRAIDYGLDMLACIWMAVDEQGQGYVYKELCKKNLVTSDAATAILALDAPDEHPACTYAPRDLWARTKDTGIPMAEQFGRAGLPLVKVQNGRVAGWINVKEWLKPAGEDKTPHLRIFANCGELIRCLPLLQYSEKDPNDCATEPHDITHITDALRYMLDGRPRLADPVVEKDTDYPDYDDQVGGFLDYGW